LHSHHLLLNSNLIGQYTCIVIAFAALYLCAGGPSMIMLIQRICMALSGLGRPSRVETVIRQSAAMLLHEGQGKE